MNNEILERVKKCIRKVSSNPAIEKAENYDKPLTGRVLCISSIEMVYILLELTEEFQIKFDAADVADYGFNTINGIVSIIENKLQQSEGR